MNIIFKGVNCDLSNNSDFLQYDSLRLKKWTLLVEYITEIAGLDATQKLFRSFPDNIKTNTHKTLNDLPSTLTYINFIVPQSLELTVSFKLSLVKDKSRPCFSQYYAH